MRYEIGLMAVLVTLLPFGAAEGADYKTLRNLQGLPASIVQPLVEGAKAQPIRFAKMVVHPREGEPWAIIYESVPLRAEGDKRPSYELLAWDKGRLETDAATFTRAFDEELQKAGFKSGGSDSLFDRDEGSADLQVAVLIEDIKGRFCTDCPNLLNRKGVGAVVTMNARWEVYSTLQGKVVFKTTTAGGAVIPTRLQGTIEPAIVAAFQDNVRLLLGSVDFRTLVTAPVGIAVPGTAGLEPITFRSAASGARALNSSAEAVAAIFSGDSLGTGFLISSEGHLLTNRHVVGAAKYVKIRWSDKTETLGEVLRSDRQRDVALIKVSPGNRLPLALRREAANLGETVLAIGTPLDERLQGTITKGIVSANRVYDAQPFIQSDVTINGGNSGGPLLDETGAVLGITVSGYDVNGAPAGLNLFIPIEDALRVLALKPAS